MTLSSTMAPSSTVQPLEMMEWLKADGKAGEDHSALVRYYESLGNDTVRR